MENPREDFVTNGPNNKILSHFFHIYYGLGDSKWFLGPIFQKFARFSFAKISTPANLLVFRDFGIKCFDDLRIFCIIFMKG
jgi:hypothetical protein